MKHDNSEPKSPIAPVTLRPCHDYWTVERQIAFVEALAKTGIAEEACRWVDMADSTAHALRRRPEQP